MKSLQSVQGLVVRQKKEMAEVFTGFETKNAYEVFDLMGQMLFLAVEEGGSFLVRWFLKALRPFEIFVRSTDDQDVLKIKRPFRFFFHEATVYDGLGRELGRIKREFSLLRRVYAITGRMGETVYRLVGPVFRPWTFLIHKGGAECGKIAKKWSGVLKETFTDADNFGVEFPPDARPQDKALLLGAVFLIDFVHFENKGNRR
ncbi:MAG: scramblase [Deltaproteobacteria bacterium]|nr:scramblase [Deltaproteobacteria bacterium]